MSLGVCLCVLVFNSPETLAVPSLQSLFFPLAPTPPHTYASELVVPKQISLFPKKHDSWSVPVTVVRCLFSIWLGLDDFFFSFRSKSPYITVSAFTNIVIMSWNDYLCQNTCDQILMIIKTGFKLLKNCKTYCNHITIHLAKKHVFFYCIIH